MKRLLPLIAGCLIMNAAGAGHAADAAARSSKSGFKGEAGGFGGPTSVGEQLREDDELKEPAFRFPGFDAFFTPGSTGRRGSARSTAWR